jgi:HSP20 family protein
MATEIQKGRERRGGSSAESLAHAQDAVLADADIYETDDHLILRADLPGVPKGSVQIEVDESNVLQIRAKSAFEEPQGALYREWEPSDFIRSFRIGEEFDKDHIAATLENGTLELKLAKREEVKPRRIEINA